MVIMSKPHQGTVFLNHSFSEAWAFLREEGRIDLETQRKGTPFQAEANITTKGRHEGEQVIIFYQRGVEFGRSYPCCWGRYYNCNRTRIGMYCEALDKFIR